MKKQISDIARLYKDQTPIVSLTAYTTPMAQIAGRFCDILLVGDSVSMVLYGHDTTQQATMDMMIAHGQAVTRANPDAVVIVDMPYGSYDTPQHALENAQKIMADTKCDGIKLEGGTSHAETISHLVRHHIPVLGHIGLLPQSVTTPEGYKVQGRDEDSARQLIKDAQSVADSGAFGVVIECIPAALATDITAAISIPTIGIGASSNCSGQILVTEDMLGITLGKKPKFVKEYKSLSDFTRAGIELYAQDVRKRQFPCNNYSYGTEKPVSLKKAS